MDCDRCRFVLPNPKLTLMKVQLLVLALLFSSSLCFSQAPDSLYYKVNQASAKYLSGVDKKINSVSEKLTKKSEKYLAKLEKQELKLQRTLSKLNPESAKKLFSGTKEKYDQLTDNLKNKTSKATKLLGGQYNSYVDTLSTSLSFLSQFKDISGKVKEPMESLNKLESKFQESQKIKDFIAERKQQMKELLSKYTNVPASLKKQYEKYTKQAYYYSAQIKEYKEMLKDPQKIEKKTLSLLNKLPAFQKFMKENSQLASLFRLPGDNGTAQNLTGLQTRASIQNLIQQQISIGGPNAQNQIQQNLAQAHAEMDKLKDTFVCDMAQYQDRLYLVDALNNVVMVMTEDGQRVTQLQEQLRSPVNIIFSDNQMFITNAESNDQRVMIYDVY